MLIVQNVAVVHSQVTASSGMNENFVSLFSVSVDSSYCVMPFFSASALYLIWRNSVQMFTCSLFGVVSRQFLTTSHPASWALDIMTPVTIDLSTNCCVYTTSNYYYYYFGCFYSAFFSKQMFQIVSFTWANIDIKEFVTSQLDMSINYPMAIKKSFTGHISMHK